MVVLSLLRDMESEDPKRRLKDLLATEYGSLIFCFLISLIFVVVKKSRELRNQECWSLTCCRCCD